MLKRTDLMTGLTIKIKSN